MHDKKRAYRRNGVQEYIVWQVCEKNLREEEIRAVKELFNRSLLHQRVNWESASCASLSLLCGLSCRQGSKLTNYPSNHIDLVGKHFAQMFFRKGRTESAY